MCKHKHTHKHHSRCSHNDSSGHIFILRGSDSSSSSSKHTKDRVWVKNSGKTLTQRYNGWKKKEGKPDAGVARKGSVKALSVLNDSKDAIEGEKLKKLTTGLKVTLLGIHRRLVVEPTLTYWEFTYEIEKLFKTNGPFTITYQDIQKDFVTASSTTEILAMLRMANDESDGQTHVFVEIVDED